MDKVVLQETITKLAAAGFSGLYRDGECGCTVDDLAPCGDAHKDEGEEWINGCDAGYKHTDPRCGDFVVSQSKEPPTAEEFDAAFAQC